MATKENTEKQPITCREELPLFFKYHWKGVIVFLTPLIFLPIIIFKPEPAYRCMYIMAIMAIYWVTEALPLFVTSMIPIVAFPVAGIMSTEDTCKVYFKDVVVMFIGGIMMALAVEYSNLHKRVALRVIQIIGCSPRRLHLGLSTVTMFLSMWISNAASTAMMCPIIRAILEELQAQGLCQMYKEETDEEAKKKAPEDLPYPSKISICFYLGTAYSSSMGGCGTLIGTGTNLTFKGIYESRFPDAKDNLDFPIFMFYSVPIMLVNTILIYIYLEWLYMGLCRPNSKEAQQCNIGKNGEEIARRVIDERYQELGPMTCHEISVLILFITLVILYFTRKPGIFTGWAELLDAKEIKNSTPTMLIIIICFILPANWVFFRCYSNKYEQSATKSLLSWSFLQQRVPWGLIFLLGGGFALAEGSKASGMASLIGNALIGLKHLPAPAVLLIVIIVGEVMTEFSSNVAICNIIVPVLAEMAVAIEIHPLYLIFPAGLACSMAFHLPVSTPANALVAGYANIKTKDMAIAGIGPSFMTIIVLFSICQTWGIVVYPNLITYPDWATSNSTE